MSMTGLGGLMPCDGVPSTTTLDLALFCSGNRKAYSLIDSWFLIIMTDHQQHHTRKLLGRQPARTIILDTSSPFIPQIGEDICDVLENLFALACNINGPSRIPFFSIIALNGYPELFLPLSFVKNNFERIQKSISDLRGICNGNLQNNKDRRGDIVLGIMEACSQYRRQLHTMLQSGGMCYQLEVIVITCQKSQVVQKQIEESSVTLDLENLKKIQVISLTSLDFDVDGVTCGSQVSPDSIGSNSSATNGLVETINLEADALILQNFFNIWLLDSGTDTEHMHIILPPSTLGSLAMVVKCDLQERILNPAQMPFFGQYTVNPDAYTMKLVFPSTSKAMGMTIPLYKLRVMNLLPSSSLCDSVVFGMPMVAQATSCWKVDWDDLERNQQVFNALCRLLIKKNCVMIAQLEDMKNIPISSGMFVNQSKDTVGGYFVLLPAPNGTMLIKSLACQELVLPCMAPSQVEEPTEDTCKDVEDSLEKLEIIATFNPLLWTSGLFSCIRNKQKKRSVPKLMKVKADMGSNNGTDNTFSSNRSSGETGLSMDRQTKVMRDADSLLNIKQTQTTKRFKNKEHLQFPTHL
ncbi:hypothetical protein ScPMuIL_016645 [Solemya velum]